MSRKENTVKKIYRLLAYEIKAPKTFGLFHLTFAAIIAFTTAKLCKRAPNDTERRERKTALIFWLILLFFETYKQIIYSVSLQGDEFIWQYAWGSFPFQLCSMPLYVLPFIAFLPHGRLRESFVAFYGSYILLGGLAVCVYPGSAFTETLGVNIQTMVWHGSQVILGIYFNVNRFANDDTITPKGQLLSAFPLFLSSVSIAVILNVVIQNMLDSIGISEVFNMFYISPYHESIFPILDKLSVSAPYPLFILTYVTALTVFSFILLSACKAAVLHACHKGEVKNI